MELNIISEVAIKKGVITKDEREIFHAEGQNFTELSKAIYNEFNVDYPKFFKMDDLSKLGFMTCEVLLDDKAFPKSWDGSEVALILGNRSSSINQDRKHYESIKNRNNYFPSPAVFVYTLPNIMLGEICIRHKITGENSCLLMEDYDGEFFNTYVRDLLENGNYKYCIYGWVNINEEVYSSKLFLAGKRDQIN